MTNPYEGYRVYGPYIHAKEQRRFVQLVSPNGRTTTSYARYLMSMHLGRLLERSEEVDHEDNNKLNDSLENLQILSSADNKKKASGKGRAMVDLVCPNCNVTFTRERRVTHLVKGGKYPTSCSRECSRMYQFNQDKINREPGVAK